MREVRAFAELVERARGDDAAGLGGFPASHPLNIGMMGMHGEAWVNHAIQEADLLLAFGMRFDDRVTGNLKTYALNAKKIHIDIDPSEINKNVIADAAICADLREALQDLLDVVGKHDHRAWLDYIGSMRGMPRARHPGAARQRPPLRTARDQPTSGASPTATRSSPPTWASTRCGKAQYYKHESPRTLITSGGLGTMGFGLPAAIGAKMARPDAEVWAIVGDGGFQMTQAELTTAAQEGVKVNVAIINNGFLGMVRPVAGVLLRPPLCRHPLRSPDSSNWPRRTACSACGSRSAARCSTPWSRRVSMRARW
jgi:acetolactate synthase-1/2/3 large subunit